MRFLRNAELTAKGLAKDFTAWYDSLGAPKSFPLPGYGAVQALIQRSVKSLIGKMPTHPCMNLPSWSSAYSGSLSVDVPTIDVGYEERPRQYDERGDVWCRLVHLPEWWASH